MERLSNLYHQLEEFQGGKFTEFADIEALEISKEKALGSKNFKVLKNLTKSQLKLVNKFKSAVFGEFKGNINFEEEFKFYSINSKKFGFKVQSFFQFKIIKFAVDTFGFDNGFTNYVKFAKQNEFKAVSFEEFTEVFDTINSFNSEFNFKNYVEFTNINDVKAVSFDNFKNIFEFINKFGVNFSNLEFSFKAFNSFFSDKKFKSISFENFGFVVKSFLQFKDEVNFIRFSAINSKVNHSIMNFDEFKFASENFFFSFQKFTFEKFQKSFGNEFFSNQFQFNAFFSSVFNFGFEKGTEFFFEFSEAFGVKKFDTFEFESFFKESFSFNVKEIFNTFENNFSFSNQFSVSFADFEDFANTFFHFEAKSDYSLYFKDVLINENSFQFKSDFVSKVDFILNVFFFMNEILNTQLKFFSYLEAVKFDSNVFFFDVSFNFYSQFTKENKFYQMSKQDFNNNVSVFREFFKGNVFTESQTFSYSQYFSLMGKHNFNILIEKDFNEFVGLIKSFDVDKYFEFVSKQVFFDSNSTSMIKKVIDEFSSFIKVETVDFNSFKVFAQKKKEFVENLEFISVSPQFV
jgi:hypothetical protein